LAALASLVMLFAATILVAKALVVSP